MWPVIEFCERPAAGDFFQLENLSSNGLVISTI
jgi:hypothetical protein